MKRMLFVAALMAALPLSLIHIYFLSDCYLRTGERGDAIETLTELAGQGTNQYSVTVLEKLSELTYEDKRYDEAAAAFRKLYDVCLLYTSRCV